MSLKEWKNNEINTKLMKKWGLLKEAKEEVTEEVEELEEGCPSAEDYEEVYEESSTTAPHKISIEEVKDLTRRIFERIQEERGE